jgi:anti-anti-sigma factor
MTITREGLPTRQLPHVVINLCGELGIAEVHQLRERLQEAISLHPERLVLDFSDCSHLDAQVILLLLDVHAELWRDQSRLALRGCSAQALRLLDLAGVRQVFEFESPTER